MSENQISNRKIENNENGSPDPGEPVFILIGKVRRPHGVDGELIVDAYSEDPQRFEPGNQVYLGEEHLPQVIHSRRSHDKALLITFKGIDDPDAAGNLRNQLVYIHRENLPSLPEGKYYHFDLIGLNVFDTSGNSIGKLVEVLETGANDVYVVKNDQGEETLLPAITQVIIEVNLADGCMVVDPPEWL